MELLILLDQQQHDDIERGDSGMETVDIGNSSDDSDEDSGEQTFQLTRWYAESAIRYPPWLSTVLVILTIMLFIVTAYLRSWFFVANAGELSSGVNNGSSDIADYGNQ
jgi:hypothetical protein